MTEGNHHQLQFDILETVRLHPHQEGIGSLLSLDLFPDVKIEDQGTHLKIHGYLRLNGEYVGEKGEGASAGEEEESEVVLEQRENPSGLEELAYVIPVEITLPADRVDTDRISSDIESFDYQVLSPFELQIEAVLTIDGFREGGPKKEEPEYEVVDRVTSFSVPEPGHLKSGDSEEGKTEEESTDDETVIAREDLDSPQEEYQFVHVARNDPVGGEEAAETLSAEDESKKGEEEEDSQEEVVSGSEGVLQVEPDSERKHQEEEPFEQAAEEDVEEPEKTGVFHPQPPIRDREDNHVPDRFLRTPHDGEFDFQDLTEEERRYGLEQTEAEETEGPLAEDGSAVDEGEQGEEAAGTGLDWIKWMVREQEETFTTLRMVIVHEEDTIDALAERYEVPASKLLTMNQLASHILEEGQIIYLPTEH